MKLIDVHGEENPVILALTPAGPAETAGLKEGERVVSVSARPVESVAGFLAILETLSPGEEATYTMAGEAGTREVSVRHLSTPLLLPFRDSEILYNKAIADLMQSAVTLPGNRQESYSWLNIGVALMHFGQWELAVKEAFRRVDLPEIAGVGRGTARYLTGACYENLGLNREARAAYEEAAQAQGATLGTHDGPRLSESASLRAARLAASE